MAKEEDFTTMDCAPWEGDAMNRREAAEALTNFLDNGNDIDVLNINSPWGTGKSFFIQHWHKHMQETRGSVYFNAWKNDHFSDPFISIVATINDQLSKQVGKKEAIKKEFSAMVSSAAKASRAAAPSLIKAFIKGVAKVDLDDVDFDSLSDASEKAVETLIEEHGTRLEEVEAFRQSLKKLSKAVAKQKRLSDGTPAIYIFIDELDRCRPTYAIELLERVKHFFDVDGCKFVIASDTGQLEHSIQAVYGAGFESNKYLKRFFDAEYKLDNSDVDAWIVELMRSFDESIHSIKVENSAEQRQQDGMYNPFDPRNVITLSVAGASEVGVILKAISKSFKMNLRDLKACVKKLNFVRANVEGELFHPFWALYLIAQYSIGSERLSNIKAEGFTFDSPAGDFWLNISGRMARVDAIAAAYLSAAKEPVETLRGVRYRRVSEHAYFMFQDVDSLSSLERYVDLVRLSNRVA